MGHTCLNLNGHAANSEFPVTGVAKSRLFRIAVSLITFSLGSAAVFLFSGDLFPSEEANTPVAADTAAVAQPEAFPASLLTFTHSGGIACGSDSDGNRASWTSYEASDGAKILSEIIFTESERRADKRFEKELRTAHRVFELGPLLNYRGNDIGRRALIEKKGRFVLVRYSRNGSESSIQSLSAKDPKYVRALAEQQESLARSFYVNRLKP